MKIVEAMAIADHLRAGRETPQALMNALAAELNEEADKAGWPGIAITTLTYDSGDVLISVEPGKGRLSIERMRAWLGKATREAREKAAVRQAHDRQHEGDEGGVAA